MPCIWQEIQQNTYDIHWNSEENTHVFSQDARDAVRSRCVAVIFLYKSRKTTHSSPITGDLWSVITSYGVSFVHVNLTESLLL